MVQWCSIVSGKHDDCHDQGAVKYGSRPGHDSSRADIVCIVGMLPLRPAGRYPWYLAHSDGAQIRVMVASRGFNNFHVHYA